MGMNRKKSKSSQLTIPEALSQIYRYARRDTKPKFSRPADLMISEVFNRNM